MEITYSQALNQAIAEEMRRDEKIYAIGENIGIYGGGFGVTAGLYEEFGEKRVVETPISETGFVGTAIGSAITGLSPIVEIMFSDFMTVCWDQIVNQAAKMRYMFGGGTSVPMVIRTPSGGGTGAAAQHSQSLETMLAHVPGLKVVIPSTPYDAKGLLKTAIRDDNPVMFLEQKLLYSLEGEVPEEDYSIPFGKADIKKQGTDCTIITYGRMVHYSLETALNLEEEGIDVEVVDLRSISPLDTETIINSAKKTGRIVVVHEAVEFAGFGGEIVATIVESDAFYSLKAPVIRVGGEFAPVPFSPNLEREVFPTIDKITKAVYKVMKSPK